MAGHTPSFLVDCAWEGFVYRDMLLNLFRCPLAGYGGAAGAAATMASGTSAMLLHRGPGDVIT
jgi:hypothetical protein